MSRVMLIAATIRFGIDPAEIERFAFAAFCLGRDPRHEVADVDHAARVVERLVIDGQPRVLGLAEHLHQLVHRDAFVHRDDVGARHHHVLDQELAEMQDAAKHAALLHVERVALAARERVLDQLAQIGLFAEPEGLKQPLEPRRLLVGRSLLLGRNVVFGNTIGVAHDNSSETCG